MGSQAPDDIRKKGDFPVRQHGGCSVVLRVHSALVRKYGSASPIRCGVRTQDVEVSALA